MDSRETLMQQISEVSFAVNDLTLYLDTHPTDQEALNKFHKYLTQRKDLLSQYESKFEPLTVNCIKESNTNQKEINHFTWVDGPLPWEGGLS